MVSISRMELNVWPHIPCVTRSTVTTWTVQSVSHQCGPASMDGWVSIAPQNDPVACVSCVVGAGFVIASPSPRHPYPNEFILSIINKKRFPYEVLPSCHFTSRMQRYRTLLCSSLTTRQDVLQEEIFIIYFLDPYFFNQTRPTVFLNDNLTFMYWQSTYSR